MDGNGCFLKGHWHQRICLLFGLCANVLIACGMIRKTLFSQHSMHVQLDFTKNQIWVWYSQEWQWVTCKIYWHQRCCLLFCARMMVVIHACSWYSGRFYCAHVMRVERCGTWKKKNESRNATRRTSDFNWLSACLPKMMANKRFEMSCVKYINSLHTDVLAVYTDCLHITTLSTCCFSR